MGDWGKNKNRLGMGVNYFKKLGIRHPNPHKLLKFYTFYFS
jgi:hypothetical protein